MTTGSVSQFLQMQQGIYRLVLIVLGLLLFACLIRAVRGPRVADRLVAVNMAGTMVMVMIAVLSMYYQEDYLLDICLIYAMASFLAVIVLTKVYIGIYEEQRSEREGGEEPGGLDIRKLHSEMQGSAEKSESEEEQQTDEHLGVD